jgi:hypothetical protein
VVLLASVCQERIAAVLKQEALAVLRRAAALGAEVVMATRNAVADSKSSTHASGLLFHLPNVCKCSIMRSILLHVYFY